MSRRIYRVPAENNSTYQMLDVEEFHDAFPRPKIDGTPMQPPIGYKREEPLHLKIRQMLMSEKLRQETAEAGFETPEEADDFDVNDDDDHLPIAEAELNYMVSQAPQPVAPTAPQPPPPANPPPAGPIAPAPAPVPGAEPPPAPKSSTLP